MREITERKKTSHELQWVNEQLQISIDQMPVGYILWDRAFRVLEWNHAAEKIFGYLKSEVLGKYAADFIVPVDKRYKVDEVIRYLQEGKVSSYSGKDNNIRKTDALAKSFIFLISLSFLIVILLHNISIAVLTISATNNNKYVNKIIIFSSGSNSLIKT